MKVALAQMACRLGDVAYNCRTISRLIAQAASSDCDVVIFPETADTGFETTVIRQCASTFTGDPSLALRRGASENQVYVLCGVTERTDRGIYNALAVFTPDGHLLSIYRKIHLINSPPFNEGECFLPGCLPVVVEINGLRWGLTICYDLRFPELFRHLVLSGAQVLVVCAAWPAFRPMHWDILTRARAIENQAYVLAVDRVGTDAAITYAGRSRIISPSGEIEAEGGNDTEELVIGEINPITVQSLREIQPTLAARRADVYGNFHLAR